MFFQVFSGDRFPKVPAPPVEPGPRTRWSTGCSIELHRDCTCYRIEVSGPAVIDWPDHEELLATSRARPRLGQCPPRGDPSAGRPARAARAPLGRGDAGVRTRHRPHARRLAHVGEPGALAHGAGPAPARAGGRRALVHAQPRQPGGLPHRGRAAVADVASGRRAGDAARARRRRAARPRVLQRARQRAVPDGRSAGRRRAVLQGAVAEDRLGHRALPTRPVLHGPAHGPRGRRVLPHRHLVGRGFHQRAGAEPARAGEPPGLQLGRPRGRHPRPARRRRQGRPRDLAPAAAVRADLHRVDA